MFRLLPRENLRKARLYKCRYAYEVYTHIQVPSYIEVYYLDIFVLKSQH